MLIIVKEVRKMDKENKKIAWTVHEVAKLLKTSPNSIYNAIKRGEIPYVRIGKLIRIPGAALDDMLGAAKKNISDQSLSVRQTHEH
jgi:excisionase family DNA binding protein